ISIAANKNSSSLMNEFIPQMSHAQRRELSPIIKKLQEEKKIYDFDELIEEVEKSSINLKTKAALSSWLLDLASTGFFNKIDSPPLEEVAKLGQLTVFDLSSFIHLKERQIILTYFARKLFDLRRQGKIPPFILFVEESHQFCPEGEEAASAISRNIIEQIAREGRKFGACLVLITQRPIRLATTALSQCNTHIIMRINNPYDIKHIGESSEGVTKDVLEMLPGLKVGEALIVGEAVNYPLLLKVRERKSKKSEKGRSLEEEILAFVESENKKIEDLGAFK
ncbi:MAG: ATP-binding protein, partial [Candidatus Brockarchaeota archaeon]|nr:ATP-binding protein [Candidatus Brockarchaeota archaeon]